MKKTWHREYFVIVLIHLKHEELISKFRLPPTACIGWSVCILDWNLFVTHVKRVNILQISVPMRHIWWNEPKSPSWQCFNDMAPDCWSMWRPSGNNKIQLCHYLLLEHGKAGKERKESWALMPGLVFEWYSPASIGHVCSFLAKRWGFGQTYLQAFGVRY